MKRTLVIFYLLLLSLPCLSQEKSINYGLSAGRAYMVVHGGTNLSGLYVSVAADRSIVKNWLSVMGRLGSNFMTAPVPEIDNFEEISRGVNLDAEIHTYLTIGNFRPSLSAGPSIRYGREQNVTVMSIMNNKATYYEYYNTTGVFLGYTLGIGLDYQLLPNFSLGGRLAVNDYPNGSQYGVAYKSLAFVIKFKR